MRIQRVYFYGFGCLKDREIQFEKGLNLLMAGNETGKSTLLQGIFALLYGPYKEGLRVRKEAAWYARYQPWIAERYGGEIDYTLSGRTFRLRRLFRNNRETVHCIDLLTGRDLTSLYPKDQKKVHLFLESEIGLSGNLYRSIAYVSPVEGEDKKKDRSRLAEKMTQLLKQGADLDLSPVIEDLHKELKEIGNNSKGSKKPLGFYHEKQKQLAAQLIELKEIYQQHQQDENRLDDLRKQKELLNRERSRLQVAWFRQQKYKEQLAMIQQLEQQKSLQEEYDELKKKRYQLKQEIEHLTPPVRLTAEDLQEVEFHAKQKEKYAEKKKSLLKQIAQFEKKRLEAPSWNEKALLECIDMLKKGKPQRDSYLTLGLVFVGFVFLFFHLPTAVVVFFLASFSGWHWYRCSQALAKCRPILRRSKGKGNIIAVLEHELHKLREWRDMEIMVEHFHKEKKQLDWEIAQNEERLRYWKEHLGTLDLEQIHGWWEATRQIEKRVWKIEEWEIRLKRLKERLEKLSFHNWEAYMEQWIGSCCPLEDRMLLQSDIEGKLKDIDQQLEHLNLEMGRMEKRLEDQKEKLMKLSLVETEWEVVKQKIHELEQERNVIQLTIELLKETAMEMQEQLTPRLTPYASEWISEMTERRYQNLLLDPEDGFRLSVFIPETGQREPVEHLSTGTMKQMFMALRMALLSFYSDATGIRLPLLLDDSFLHYDEKRLRLTLRKLAQLSKTHQVILCTCQKREKEILQEEGIPFFEPNGL